MDVSPVLSVAVGHPPRGSAESGRGRGGPRIGSSRIARSLVRMARLNRTGRIQAGRRAPGERIRLPSRLSASQSGSTLLWRIFERDLLAVVLLLFDVRQGLGLRM